MSGLTEETIGAIRARRLDGTAHADEVPVETLTVSPAILAEGPAVIDVVVDAFVDDPTWSWAFPDRAVRKRWWDFCVRSALRYPWVLKTGGFEAVSVWIPPSGSELSPADERRVPALLEELVGDRAAEVAELLHRFELSHPRGEPHYYLSLLGTRSDQRGRGLGMSLLRENLARIDAERAPAYLESSNPGNDQRYESVGFAKVVSFRAPGGGPIVTGMWRKAR